MAKGLIRQNNSFDKYVSLWNKASKETIQLGKYGLLGLAVSSLSVLFTLASAGMSATLKVAQGMLSLVGITIGSVLAVIDAIRTYKGDIDKMKELFVKALNDPDRVS